MEGCSVPLCAAAGLLQDRGPAQMVPAARVRALQEPLQERAAYQPGMQSTQIGIPTLCIMHKRCLRSSGGSIGA